MASKRKTYFIHEVKKDEDRPGNYMVVKVRIGKSGKMSEKKLQDGIPNIEQAFVEAATYRIKSI